MWDGAFRPFDLRKSVDEVSFKELEDMTWEDWRTLDYKNLRPVAKNRIADTIVEGELIGFFIVDVSQKARNKPRYLWPVTRSMRKRHERNEEDHRFFTNEADDSDFPNDNADEVDDLTYRLARKIMWGTFLGLIAKAIDAMDDDDDEKAVNELAFSKLSDGRMDFWEDRDAAIVLAAWLYRLYGRDLNEVLDEVDPTFV